MARSTQQQVSRRERRSFTSFSLGIRLRVASLLVIFSVFVAFGLRLSHMLLVQHVICEHGHLVDERRTAPNEENVRGTDPSDHAEDRDAGKLDDHDHCDVMSELHRSDGFSIVPRVTTLCWIAPMGIQEARETQPIDIITLAPKSSPPVV